MHYAFGSFSYDVARGKLSCYGVDLPLTPKTSALLQYFLEHPQRIITKAELLDALWPHEDVIEANLAQHVFLLRQAFATHSPGESFIVTAARQGYRFVAPVQHAVPAQPKRDASWKDYVEGRFFADQRTADSLQRAIRAYERAIAGDANHAASFAGVAEANVLAAEYLFAEPVAAFSRARHAAERALALDPDNVQAHVSLSDVYLFHDWDFVRSYEALERAAWLDPAASSTRLNKAWFFGIVGNHAGATAEVEAVLAREPFSLKAMTTLAALAVLHADFDVAIEMSEAVLSLDPSYEIVEYYLRAGLAFSGRCEEALALHDAKAAHLYPQQSLAIAAYAAGRAGMRDKAASLLDDIERTPEWPYVSAFNLALPRVALGDMEGAYRCLRTGIDRRDPWSVFVLVHPAFRDLPHLEELRAAIAPQNDRL